MRSSLRVLLAVLAGSLGCVGGPVSDWPSKSHDAPTGGPVSPVDDGDEDVRAPNERPIDNSVPGGNPATGGDSSAFDGGTPPSVPEFTSDGAVPDGGACGSDAGSCADRCAESDAGVGLDPSLRASLGCTVSGG